MRKIFLDCGGHVGQSISNFKRVPFYTSDFIIYSFEPVPFLNKQYKNIPDIIFSDKAVWISDCEMDFYISKRRRGVGSTLKKEKWSCLPDKEHPIKVKCFDFSKWIMDVFTKEDYIVVKMDIEGAEYDVLNKMLNDGSIYYIKKLFMEFHFDKMIMDKTGHDQIVERLKNIEGLELLPELRVYLKKMGLKNNKW